MKTIYFKCTLLTDIVLNVSMATEGNMQTLSYIPGSNFLGIVAAEIYKKLSNEDAYAFFHSGEVSFGDALITDKKHQSYVLPFSLYTNKLKKNLTQDKVWIHHYLNKNNRPEDEENNFIQLKQHRGGFFNSNNDYFKEVTKAFALKSAQNRKERRSKKGAMFGFESIRKGQTFIFSIILKNDKYEEKIKSAFKGIKRIGKSKSAQYGRVEIKEIESPITFESQESDKKQLVIYAESNLCFLNKFGQSTYQPSLKDFKIPVTGSINWAASQIRTYSYSPWNGQRNTSSTQRDCLLKGSVLVIDLEEKIDVKDLPYQVGEYNSEGLGRVLYNPIFLKADVTALWQTQLKSYKVATPIIEQATIQSPLAILLKKKKDKKQKELEIGQAIIGFIRDNKFKFKDISSSQWGGIRAKAIQAKNIDSLKIALFGVDETTAENNNGFLMNGVAAEKYWDKNKGELRQLLLRVLIQHRHLNTDFIAKLASEMAKFKQQEQNS